MDILKMSEEHVEECTDLYIDAFTKSPWHDAYDSRAQVVSFFQNHRANNYFLGYVLKRGRDRALRRQGEPERHRVHGRRIRHRIAVQCGQRICIPASFYGEHGRRFERNDLQGVRGRQSRYGQCGQLVQHRADRDGQGQYRRHQRQIAAAERGKFQHVPLRNVPRIRGRQRLLQRG